MRGAQNSDKNKTFPAPRGMGYVPWRRNAKTSTARGLIRRPLLKKQLSFRLSDPPAGGERMEESPRSELVIGKALCRLQQ